MFILGKIDIYFPTDVHAIVLVHVFEKKYTHSTFVTSKFCFFKIGNYEYRAVQKLSLIFCEVSSYRSYDIGREMYEILREMYKTHQYI